MLGACLAAALLLQAVSSRAQPEPVREEESAVGTGVQPAAGPEERLLPEMILRQAVDLFRDGQAREAADLITAAVAADRSADGLAVVYARELGQLDQFDQAIAFLRGHLESVPDNYRAALELGVLLSTLLQHNEAAHFFSLVPPEAGRVYTMAHFNLGRSLRLAGRFEEAQALYEGLLDGSSAAMAQAVLCEIELAAGDREGCRSCLATARQQYGPGSGFDRIEVFLAYLDGDLDRAEQLLNDLLAHGTFSARLASYQVLLPLARGQLEQAANALESLQTANVLGEVYALEAIIAMLRGDRQAAQASYRTAVTRNPLFLEPHRAAQILLWRPELEEILASVERPGEGSGTGALPLSGSTTASAPGAGEAMPEQGCCHLTARRASGSSSLIGLALLALLCSMRRPPTDRFQGPRRDRTPGPN